MQKTGYPSVLKSADFGYDGKGQFRIRNEKDLAQVWNQLGVPAGVLEAWIPHQGEFSVIVSRNSNGEKKAFPVAENHHVHHILHTSAMPANLSNAESKELVEIAYAVVDAFDMVGMAAIEFFRAADGWLVNEIAPRPHNSGHLTFDACLTSQFEQCVRATCGLPFGETTLLRPGVMMNLMGDLWQKGEPDWAKVLAYPNLKLHLYGKKQPKPGRKMGHLCVMDDQLAQALQLTRQLEAILGIVKS